MALEDGDYGGTFGGFSDFLDPAMGRILAENPEALINHFADAGIPPPGPQFAENFAPRFDASFPPAQTDAAPMIPASGSVGGPSPYEQPASAYGSQSPQRSIWDSIMSGVAKSQAAGAAAAAAPPVPAKVQDRVAPGEPGRVPPSALNQNTAVPDTLAPLVVPQQPLAAEPDTSEGSYTPSTQYATVAGGTGEPGGDTAALPQSDPRKAAADTKSSDLAKTVSALAGIKAPPAPPQPQLRPFAGERAAAIPATSPIAALLAGVLAGSPGAAAQLRLAQAVGGK